MCPCWGVEVQVLSAHVPRGTPGSPQPLPPAQRCHDAEPAPAGKAGLRPAVATTDHRDGGEKFDDIMREVSVPFTTNIVRRPTRRATRVRRDDATARRHGDLGSPRDLVDGHDVSADRARRRGGRARLALHRPRAPREPRACRARSAARSDEAGAQISSPASRASSPPRGRAAPAFSVASAGGWAAARRGERRGRGRGARNPGRGADFLLTVHGTR